MFQHMHACMQLHITWSCHEAYAACSWSRDYCSCEEWGFVAESICLLENACDRLTGLGRIIESHLSRDLDELSSAYQGSAYNPYQGISYKYQICTEVKVAVRYYWACHLCHPCRTVLVIAAGFVFPWQAKGRHI